MLAYLAESRLRSPKSRKYLRTSFQIYAFILNFASIYQKTLHAPADKKASRVPAYQNGRKSAGTAILCVKSLPWNPVILQSKQYRRILKLLDSVLFHLLVLWKLDTEINNIFL